MHGVKCSDDLIFINEYQRWSKSSRINIYFAAENNPLNNWHNGYVTTLIEQLSITEPENTVCFICGPEIMMIKAAKQLIQRRLVSDNIFLSLERNMHCGVGQCGHCQCGAQFVCQNGPVFSYSVISKDIEGRG